MKKAASRNLVFKPAAKALALLLVAYALIPSAARAEGEAGVTLDRRVIDLCPGDAFTLTATIIPEDAAAGLVWATSDGSVATVEGGVVTAGAFGTADISATTADGAYAAVCKVTVTPAEIASSFYAVDRPSGLLKGVQKFTPPGLLLANFDNPSTDLSILDQSGNVFSGRTVGTGMTVQLTVNGTPRDSLKVVVNGDVSGDGAVTISDYTLARLDILGIKKLSDEYLLAGDVNEDGQITITDYTLMRLDLLGIKPIGGSGGIDLSGIANPKIKAYLELSLTLLGKPYIWGAEGPDTFDCSGLVYYCLNKTGYKVGRSTADTYSKYGKWQNVSMEDLQPGDLMFFISDDDPGRIGHVAMYLGDGKLVNASLTYGCVVVCPFSGWYVEHFSNARRVYY